MSQPHPAQPQPSATAAQHHPSHQHHQGHQPQPGTQPSAQPGTQPSAGPRRAPSPAAMAARPARRAVRRPQTLLCIVSVQRSGPALAWCIDTPSGRVARLAPTAETATEALTEALSALADVVPPDKIARVYVNEGALRDGLRHRRIEVSLDWSRVELLADLGKCEPGTHVRCREASREALDASLTDPRLAETAGRTLVIGTNGHWSRPQNVGSAGWVTCDGRWGARTLAQHKIRSHGDLHVAAELVAMADALDEIGKHEPLTRPVTLLTESPTAAGLALSAVTDPRPPASSTTLRRLTAHARRDITFEHVHAHRGHPLHHGANRLGALARDLHRTDPSADLGTDAVDAVTGIVSDSVAGAVARAAERVA